MAADIKEDYLLQFVFFATTITLRIKPSMLMKPSKQLCVVLTTCLN